MAIKKTVTPTEKVKKSLVNRDKMLNDKAELSNAVTAARKRKQQTFSK